MRAGLYYYKGNDVAPEMRDHSPRKAKFKRQLSRKRAVPVPVQGVMRFRRDAPRGAGDADLSTTERPVTQLSIHHRTIYHYHRPVLLGPHRLMLRPRETRELR